MITGDTAWEAARTNLAKKIAVTLEFPAMGLILASFQLHQVSGLPSGSCMIVPYLKIPNGPSQSVSEIEGTSSHGQMMAMCNDPGGIVRPMLAILNFIGIKACFKAGWQGGAYSDFVVMHTLEVTDTGSTEEGWVTFTLQQPIRQSVYQIFAFGGPGWWSPGLPTPPQPVGANVAHNTQPISSENPYFLQGNPIDIWLAVMQNEVGMGQANIALSSSWTLYEPPDETTLINPNPAIDVPCALNLRDNYYGGAWMEFRITEPAKAKTWLEAEVQKPLGLYVLVRPDGQLHLKQMKSPVNL